MNLKKKVAAAAAALTIVGSAGAAYAYWTTSGSGTGSGTAASTSGTVALHASFSDGIYPGGSESVSFTADNTGPTDLYVNKIHLSSVSVDSGHSACAVADFTMADVVDVNTIVTHGTSGVSITPHGTLNYANTNVDQSGCKGATITLNLTSE